MFKTFGIFALALCLLGMTHAAEAVIVLDAFSAQGHTPTANDGGSSAPPNTYSSPDGHGNRNSYIFRNDSDPGVRITSILLTLVSPLFFDTTTGAAGADPFYDYAVAPAGNYDAGFIIALGAASNVTTGYTGATTIANGATSFLMTFTDFDPNEVFGFTADIDKGDGNGDRGITAAEWTGTGLTINFDNGGQIVTAWNIPPSEFNNRFYGLQGSVNVNVDPSIPEPSSLSLLGIGLLGLWKRRKNKKAIL